jgi:hypothetical protein
MARQIPPGTRRHRITTRQTLGNGSAGASQTTGRPRHSVSTGPSQRRSRESGNPDSVEGRRGGAGNRHWIPAFAGIRRLDILPVFRLGGYLDEVSGEVCATRHFVRGTPGSVRSVCLTGSLGTQASRLPRRGQRAALVACSHGCRRGRLRSQGGFAL